MNKIPIKNIWWLMLYASELRAHDMTGRFGVEDNPDYMPRLVAEILIHAIRRRLLRNLSVELQSRQADLARVRGRIDHIRTGRHCLLEQGKIACVFEYFTVNTPKNQYVKAALDSLSRIMKDKELKRSCHIYSRALERAGVARYAPMNTIRAKMPNTISNPEDRQMLAAAELAHNMRIPTEETGDSYMLVTDRNEKWLRRLFEKAIWGFYDAVLSHHEWSVRHGERIYWQQEFPTIRIKDILPDMQTDIVLERIDTKTRMIIDTKFTTMVTENQYGKLRLKSDHIFQLYSYLKSQENNESSYAASGMLLYPSVGENVDESVTIQGHRIRFATVDLAADSVDIRKRLLELVPS